MALKIENIAIGLGLAGAAWWLYTRQTGDGFQLPGLPAVPNSGTAVTPIMSNSVPPAGRNVTTGGSNPPAGNPAPPPVAPVVALPAPANPIGYAPVDPPTGLNFSDWMAQTYGAQRRMLSADEWNWYFSEYSKVPQTADLFAPDNRAELIDLSTYMQRRTAAGLSGYEIGFGFIPAGRYIQRRATVRGRGRV